MNAVDTGQDVSKFMNDKIPMFFGRFSLSYFNEFNCIEYFLKKRLSAELISTALIFAYNPITKDLHVSRFYPEICHQINSKYMSAVCFYLMIQHSAKVFELDNCCHISLETQPSVCENFYRKLKDFNFHVKNKGLGNVVELVSDIHCFTIDTSMIDKQILVPGELPFMK